MRGYEVPSAVFSGRTSRARRESSATFALRYARSSTSLIVSVIASGEVANAKRDASNAQRQAKQTRIILKRLIKPRRYGGHGDFFNHDDTTTRRCLVFFTLRCVVVVKI